MQKCESNKQRHALWCAASLTLAFISVGCADGTLVSPDPLPSISAAVSGPTEEPGPAALTVNGPQGCVDAARLTDVISWTFENVPPDARFLKAYHHDEEPSCEPTASELRTENDHLRVVSTSPTTAQGEYEVFAYTCGREQVNISIQVGSNEPEVLVALVIYHEGKFCPGATPPAPAPSPTPAPPSPSSPAPPCDVLHPRTFSGSGSWTIATQSTQKQARVNASYSVGNFVGRVGIYWRNNGSTYMKTSQGLNVACGKTSSGSLSWSSAWVSPSHGHVNSSARYFLVFYTGSDSSPSIVWEREL